MTSVRLDILYLDDFLVAVNKPAGLLVHRTSLDPDSELFAVQLLRNQLGRWVYPVHRLDKPTSGVLLFALTPETARKISDSFNSDQFQKSYLTILRGFCPEEGIIDYPIPSERGGSKREAVTTYKRLAMSEIPYQVGIFPTARYSLAEAVPITGRRHQLRRHFKHIFHNIIGDTQFGDRHHTRFFRDQFGLDRLFLHAWRLSMQHPETNERLIIQAPLPEYWGQMGEILGWSGIIKSLNLSGKQ